MQFTLILFHWDDIYTALGIKEFIYFISSPSIQHTLFPIKIVFIFFTVFFLCAVVWFYLNSTYLKYKFLQDTTEYFSREVYGSGNVVKSWKRIQKRMAVGGESDFRLAVIEADDFLYESLENAGYDGATLEELLEKAGKKVSVNRDAILQAHALRNRIVYEPDYAFDLQEVKEALSVFENAIRVLASS